MRLTRLPAISALQTFEVAARLGSFLAAAHARAITPSAVSHQIRNLEETLGVKLFERRAQGIRLTEDGMLYFNDVKTCLEQLEAATQKLVNRGQSEHITVRAYSSVIRRCLVPLLPKLRTDYPEITVRFVIALDPTDFVRSGLQIAIAHNSENPSGFRKYHLTDLKVHPVCTPEYLRTAAPIQEPSHLLHHTLLRNADSPSEWQTWLQLIGAPELQLQPGQVLDNRDLAIEAATISHGIALAFDVLVRSELREGVLVNPFKNGTSGFGCYEVLVPHEIDANPMVRKLRSWLVDQFV